jgi:hypothetical protein
MPEMMETPAMRAGLAMTILLVVITFAFWLLGRLRDYTTQDQHRRSEGLGNLEEMLRKGEISEAEFRTIQSSARSHLASSHSTTSPPVRSPEARFNQPNTDQPKPGPPESETTPS